MQGKKKHFTFPLPLSSEKQINDYSSRVTLGVYKNFSKPGNITRTRLHVSNITNFIFSSTRKSIKHHRVVNYAMLRLSSLE